MPLRVRFGVILALSVLAGEGVTQCAPEAKSAKQEIFSFVIEVKELKALAGIELSLKEHGTRVSATLIDHEGTSQPLETHLAGEIRESAAGCILTLRGRNKRGAVEIRGTIRVGGFQGFIERHIGKNVYQEGIFLRRKLLPKDYETG